MNRSRVRIYLDDDPEPIVNDVLPADVALDTRTLADGRHRLTVRAQDQNGNEGIEEIAFHVRNGPGIVVSGLRPNSTRGGIVQLGVDAFSADDPFDPRRAEARSSIPTWVLVMSLFIVAWAVWYAASMWQVPEAFRGTPTYAAPPVAEPSANRSGQIPAQRRDIRNPHLVLPYLDQSLENEPVQYP